MDGLTQLVLTETSPADIEYAYEELAAEFGSAYLCLLCGISNTTFDKTTTYIDGWLKIIKDDGGVIQKAATMANKAVELIYS